MSLIYHITARKDLLQASRVGEYRAESLESAGFIHFSQRHQVLGVANSFYAGQKDLVVLVVDPARLTSELKYEPPVHPGAAPAPQVPASDQLFPHLYGPLNYDAVLKVVDLPLPVGGIFELPDI
jgi:uncharacterized protein (DUF952 family)